MRVIRVVAWVLFLLVEPMECGRYKRIGELPKPGSNTSTQSKRFQHPPVLTIEDEMRVIGHPRENVELTCPVYCDPSCIFHWTKRNESILQQWDRYYFPTATKSQLQIRALKPEDGGTYECLGVNGFGSVVARLRLFVDGTDDPSETNLIKRTLFEGIAPEIVIDSLPAAAIFTVGRGHTLILNCEARGLPAPSITWFKNNLQLLDSTDNVSQLKIINWSDDDTGFYRCEAENDLGTSIYEVKIEVEGGVVGGGLYGGAAIVSLTPTNLTLLPGQSGELTCVVRHEDSITKPVLLWFKKLQNPTADAENVFVHKGDFFEPVANRPEVIQRSINTYSATLVFTNVTRRKSGTYVCFLAWPTTSGNYDFLEAQLFVPVDTAKMETIREKTAQVQWTLLWTFCFLFVSIFTVVCFSRLYGRHRDAKSKLVKDSRSPKVPPGLIRISIPTKSPGETISTTLTCQNEVFHPFIPKSEACYAYTTCEPSLGIVTTALPASVPIQSRKRTYRQRRMAELAAIDTSESDSSYESNVGNRRHTRKPRAYFVDIPGARQQLARVHRRHHFLYSDNLNPATVI